MNQTQWIGPPSRMGGTLLILVGAAILLFLIFAPIHAQPNDRIERAARALAMEDYHKVPWDPAGDDNGIGYPEKVHARYRTIARIVLQAGCSKP